MTDDSTPPQDDPLDDWDLDDDELSLGDAITPVPIGIPRRKSVEAHSEEPSPSPIPEPVPTGPEPSEAESPEPEPGPAPAPQPAPRPSSKNAKKPSSSTAIEKVSLLLVVLCLLGLGYWGVSTFLSEAPEGELVEFTTEFPAEGRKVTIQSVETWWRSPITTGDDADIGVGVDTELIPCAKITLESGGSTTLQASFRDGEGKLIGDTLNLTVESGKFASNNSTETTIHATAGFANASDINPYLNGDIDPWSFIIVESENPDTEVVKARVSKKRLKN